jgi:hypothetical protein
LTYKGPFYKHQYNSYWKLLLYHSSAENEFFTSTNVKNISTEHLYSILYQLDDSYKIDKEYFEFLIEYPIFLPEYLRWKQKVNPKTRTDDVGFYPINVNWKGCEEIDYFKGLAISTQTSLTYLDGSPSFRNWWFAIGAFNESTWNVKNFDLHIFPGPYTEDGRYLFVNEVYFWVRIKLFATCGCRKERIELIKYIILTLLYE